MWEEDGFWVGVGEWELLENPGGKLECFKSPKESLETRRRKSNSVRLFGSQLQTSTFSAYFSFLKLSHARGKRRTLGVGKGSKNPIPNHNKGISERGGGGKPSVPIFGNAYRSLPKCPEQVGILRRTPKLEKAVSEAALKKFILNPPGVLLSF